MPPISFMHFMKYNLENCNLIWHQIYNKHCYQRVMFQMRLLSETWSGLSAFLTNNFYNHTSKSILELQMGNMVFIMHTNEMISAYTTTYYVYYV